MPAHRHIRRAAAVGAALVAASALLLLLPALPASAHNSVIATSPGEGATVTEQPGIISLKTSDALLEVDGGSVIEVQGPDGRYYGDGCTVVDGPTAAMQAELGTPGEYTVTWRVVSTDGHPITGTWAFAWQPADGVSLAEGSELPAECGGTAAVSTPGAGADEASEPADSPDADGDASSSSSADALWVVGGVLVAAVAALVTWFAVRRRT
jgi:copper resistance protein C